MPLMAKQIRRSKTIKMLFALPLDVRQWLEARAELNLAPMNAVVVATLRGQMDAEKDARAGRKTEAT
jgi:hypothetical protein